MQKGFDVHGPAEIDVRLASGDIEVDPTLEGRVEVELVAHDEESQRLVDEARIELHDHHGRPQLIVDVPHKSRGFSFSLVFGRSGISCTIRCPKGSLIATGRVNALLGPPGSARASIRRELLRGGAGVVARAVHGAKVGLRYGLALWRVRGSRSWASVPD